jgi:hypothetical protein
MLDITRPITSKKTYEKSYYERNKEKIKTEVSNIEKSTKRK